MSSGSARADIETASKHSPYIRASLAQSITTSTVNSMTLNKCKVIDLEKISDPRGNLTFIESQRHVPFDIARVYYLYDVPAGESRGGHAHKQLHQLMIAASGSFDVNLDDGNSRIIYKLNRPYLGLYICPMIWRELGNFSSGSVCMVLASEIYDAADYFRNYEEFAAATGQNH